MFKCKLLSACVWQRYLSNPAGPEEVLVVVIDCVNRLYICVGVCVVHTYCASYILSLSSCAFFFSSSVLALKKPPQPRCKNKPITSGHFPGKSVSGCLNSGRYVIQTLHALHTEAIEEIYLWRGRGTTLLFSCKCVFLRDLAGAFRGESWSSEPIHRCWIFIIYLVENRPVLVSAQDVKPQRPFVAHMSAPSHHHLSAGHGMGRMPV